MAEFSNTDSELARCIKSRMRHELGQIAHSAKQHKEAEAIVRAFITELCADIISEEF